jgi:hypothetical protein
MGGCDYQNPPFKPIDELTGPCAKSFQKLREFPIEHLGN